MEILLGDKEPFVKVVAYEAKKPRSDYLGKCYGFKYIYLGLEKMQDVRKVCL
jgi:hypothetical protein